MLFSAPQADFPSLLFPLHLSPAAATAAAEVLKGARRKDGIRAVPAAADRGAAARQAGRTGATAKRGHMMLLMMVLLLVILMVLVARLSRPVGRQPRRRDLRRRFHKGPGYIKEHYQVFYEDKKRGMIPCLRLLNVSLCLLMALAWTLGWPVVCSGQKGGHEPVFSNK